VTHDCDDCVSLPVSVTGALYRIIDSQRTTVPEERQDMSCWNNVLWLNDNLEEYIPEYLHMGVRSLVDWLVVYGNSQQERAEEMIQKL
jgi:hypothetical protein